MPSILHGVLSHVELFFEESRFPWILLGAGSTYLLMNLSRKIKMVRAERSHLHHVDALRARENPKETTEQQGPGSIYQIVLTGGTCGGKSSAMDFLGIKLREMGFTVYLVPEVPTLLINGGCKYPGANGPEEKLVAFEAALIELQLQMEQSFYNIARSTGHHSVIIYDRGILDVAAFMPRRLWPVLLKQNTWLREGLLGVLERYDLIIHMTTAADGAVSHYKYDDREKESIADAIALDHRIKASYQGHPNYHIIDNSTNFAQKLERTLASVKETIQG